MSVNIIVNAILFLAGTYLGVRWPNDKAKYRFKFSAYCQFLRESDIHLEFQKAGALKASSNHI